MKEESGGGLWCDLWKGAGNRESPCCARWRPSFAIRSEGAPKVVSYISQSHNSATFIYPTIHPSAHSFGSLFLADTWHDKFTIQNSAKLSFSAAKPGYIYL